MGGNPYVVFLVPGNEGYAFVAQLAVLVVVEDPAFVNPVETSGRTDPARSEGISQNGLDLVVGKSLLLSNNAVSCVVGNSGVSCHQDAYEGQDADVLQVLS